ncbi:hypothetical protein [Pseudomonas sp. 9Ag]|uniref:hypothetical protein n=1 Tax=Pseudomonas sp. 9Ag TaxID=2653167 RepID=UPI0013587491|nr:hypothetical protein [Pseudomonas sp. 9Ag]
MLLRKLFVLRAFVIVFNIMIWSHASAEKIGGAEPNGCGTGWNAPFVPDSIIGLCDFSGACSEHDKCYAKCETSLERVCEYRRCRNGGDLYKSSECNNVKFKLLQNSAQMRRQECDVALQADIIATNKRRVCIVAGIIYRKAVRFAGDISFQGMIPVTQISDPDQYNEAISTFLTSGTEKQFEDFLRAELSGDPKVDFFEELKYDSQQGIVNQ